MSVLEIISLSRKIFIQCRIHNHYIRLKFAARQHNVNKDKLNEIDSFHNVC